MRLLICTQTVDRDDPALGFFHRWIEEFASRSEKVLVICLRKGRHTLPANVEVIALGERNRLLRALEVCTIAFGRRAGYDSVFVHMNPEYFVAAGWLWRLLGKRAGLWYVHKMTSWHLRVAALLAHTIFTVAPESVPIRSPKVHALGHGIDVPAHPSPQRPQGGIRSIVAIGRIARIKYIDTMLDALAVVHTRNIPFSFSLIGRATNPEEERFEAGLRARVAALPFSSDVHFLGAKRHEEIPALLASADILLNLTPTGSFDKVILEAMSVGVTPVICNEAFASVPGIRVVVAENPEEIADALVGEKSDAETLRAYVHDHHSLPTLIGKIVQLLS